MRVMDVHGRRKVHMHTHTNTHTHTHTHTSGLHGEPRGRVGCLRTVPALFWAGAGCQRGADNAGNDWEIRCLQAHTKSLESQRPSIFTSE